MKITNRTKSALALACVFGLSAIASAVSVETYANFLTDDEIQYFKSVHIDEEENGEVRSWGAAVLDTSISERLHKITGTQVTPKEQNEYRRSIAVARIKGTTEAHVDYRHSGGSLSFEKAEDDKVAFIFLETNPDATFVHGEAKIPSEAGKLVVFDGGVPHNTQIERGTLAIAGPFDLRRLYWCVAAPLPPVPSTCTIDDDCAPDEKCDYCAPVNRRRLIRREVLKLDEVHEREQSSAARSTMRDFEIEAQSHRRAKSCKSGQTGTCVAKSTKAPKSAKLAKRAKSTPNLSF